MKKTYLTPRTDFVLLQPEDVLTASFSNDIGMNVPSAKDKEWTFG